MGYFFPFHFLLVVTENKGLLQETQGEPKLGVLEILVFFLIHFLVEIISYGV